MRYGPSIVKNGLVLCLDAADRNSYSGTGTIWKDISPTSNNSSLINGPGYSFSNGGYFIFNGVDQYGFLTASKIPYGNQISMCFWTYGLVSQTSSIFTSSDSGANRAINIHLPWTDSIVYWDCGNNAGTFDRIQTATLLDSQWKNSWHYWCFTKNVTTGIMNIYLDGNLNVSGTGKTLTISASVGAQIATYFSITNYSYNGRMAIAKIYNRELSASEILQNYNATKGRFNLL